MMKSEQINELAKALAKAQLEMGAASKSSVNPHFKSKYAALPEVVEVAKALNKHGLAYAQPTHSENGTVTVETVLMHGESGQWLSGELTLTPQQNTPQGIGSAITYGRRFGLCSLVGIVADEDDDGNAASQRPPTKQVHTDATLEQNLRASIKNGNGASPHAAGTATGADGRKGGSGPEPSGHPNVEPLRPAGQSGPQIDPKEEKAAQLIEACEVGFKSPEHKQNWFKKHCDEINALGQPWAKEIVKAFGKAAVAA